MLRRRFLIALTELAGAAMAAGCSNNGSGGSGSSSDGGPNPNPPSPVPSGYQLAAGSVNPAEIGGSALRVHSVAYLHAPVDAGAFTTVVSTAGAQLLLIADYPANAAPSLRGFAMNVPGDARVTVDATSTALALTMLTLGILTVNPAQAAARRTTILGLASFAPFLAYLQKVLPTTDLATLNTSDSQFAALRKQVSDDFIATLQPATSAAAARRVSGFAPRAATFATGQVDGTYTPPKNPGDPATVPLSNYGYRFVEVVRRSLGSDGLEVGSPVVPTLTGAQNPSALPNLISGVNLASWGDLFVPGQFGSPGTATDSFPVDPKVAEVDYYVSGPGIPGGADLPSDISSGMFSGGTLTLTVFFYILGPLLDSLSGDEATLKELAGNNGALFVKIASLSVNLDDLVAAYKSADLDNIRTSFVSLEPALMEALKGITGAIVGAGLLAADSPLVAVITEAATITALFAGLCGIYNLETFLAHEYTVPAIGKLPLPVNPKPSFTATTVVPSGFGTYDSGSASVNKLGHVLYQATTQTQGVNNGITTATDTSSLIFWSGGHQTMIGNPLSATTVNGNSNGSQYVLYAGSSLNDVDQLIYGVDTIHTPSFQVDAFFQPAATGASATPQPIQCKVPVPYALNNLGSVVGFDADTANPNFFFWNNGAIQQSYPVDFDGLLGIAINDNNVIATVTTNAGDSAYTVATIDTVSGVTTTVSTGPANIGGPVAINSNGQVGYVEALQDGTRRAALWTAATGSQVLPLLPGDTESRFFALNNNGDAIGQSGSTLVYWRGNNVFALNSLIQTAGVTLTALTSFSNAGHVLGTFTDPDSGSVSLILLTPVAPASSSSN